VNHNYLLGRARKRIDDKAQLNSVPKYHFLG